MDTTQKGCFITFEGPDGAGKTTQIKRLSDWAASMGYSVVLTREPGGTVISEKIRELLLDNAHRDMDPVTEALLYAAARAQHVEQVIRPALTAGSLVICDRFVDSSIAYQAFGRGLGMDMIRQINAYACRGIGPGITFLMLLDPVSADKRMEGKALDRLESEKMEFKQRVMEGYQALAREEPDRVIALDAKLPEDDIAAIIRQAVSRCLRNL